MNRRFSCPSRGPRVKLARAADHSRGRTAFTLLELILSLSLSVVILMAVGMSMQIHLRSFDSRQKILEESQLARSILRIIANDIRGVVVHYEQDVSSVETLLSSAGGGGAGGGGAGSGAADESAPENGGGQSGPATEDLAAGQQTDADASPNTEDLSTTTALPDTPGIYGNEFELQIDISRLPRLDEYQQILTAETTSEVVDIPSDVKSVSYFVRTEIDDATAANLDPLAFATPGNEAASGGLVRRELDRAVTQWAVTNGAATSLMQSGELLATEVRGIQFQYFDGLEWLPEWDTEYQEGLPVAIQVVLMIGPAGQSGQTSFDEADPLEYAVRYYRLVVHLPVGEPSTGEETAL